MSIDMQRVNRLNNYISDLQSGRFSGLAAKDLYMKHQQDLLKVTPQEAFEIFTTRFKSGENAARILEYLDKVINVFHHGLESYQWEKPAASSFLGLLRRENEELAVRLDQMRDKLQAAPINSQRSSLLADLSELLEFEDHYLKKENILFSYMEKKAGRYEGVAIMWSLHDEARSCLKEAIAAFSEGPAAISDETELSILLGRLFFSMHGLVQKEEMILFPTATELFSQEEFLDMLRHSYEFAFPFIGAKEIPDRQEVKRMINKSVASKAHEQSAADIGGLLFRSETGDLTVDQVLMIFSALPVDLSFVDENNKLRFFTRPKDRVFPRSPAAIGRDVKNCHPPESVHVVEEIIEAFREGRQNQASFWIQVKDRFVLIQYFALHDSNSSYRGVLEVSQDITDIRKLQGNRRLLEWDDTAPAEY